MTVVQSAVPLMPATSRRGRPASATATTAAITCTPGGTNGVSASATTAPPRATRRWTAASGKARCSRGHSRARNAAGTTASSAAWAGAAEEARPERAEHRGDVPDDEDRGAAGEERQPGHRPVGGGDGQRRRLVDDPVRRPQPAQDTPGRQQRHEPDAVDGVAGAQQQRAADRGQRAAAGAEDADQGELRGAGEHQQRQRRRLPDVQPGRDGRRAEGRPVEADREAQARRRRGAPGSGRRRTLRRG